MKRTIVKPFLKWAGGKTQLISQIEKYLPTDILSDKFTYIEPFIGSGAVFFWMLNNFPNLEKAVISDINGDLINTYKVISSNPKELVSELKRLQAEFHKLNDLDTKKKEYYYEQRKIYNTRSANKIIQAALFIFLNRTCFNGLYRVNKNNMFNVPIGDNKNPLICDEKNILAVSERLKSVEILNVDFADTLSYATKNSFFYLDPPYKPVSSTSHFTAYAKDSFDDTEQIRLKDFCTQLDKSGYKWMLSNCNAKSEDSDEGYFDEIYTDFFILRVKAKRSINAIAERRGQLEEILITNYKYQSGLPFLELATQCSI